MAQIIASASNFYSLGTGLSKRCACSHICWLAAETCGCARLHFLHLWISQVSNQPIHPTEATEPTEPTEATTRLPPRDFTFIFGAIAMGMILIPSFRNMRLFSFLALVGTTYTRWAWRR